MRVSADIRVIAAAALHGALAAALAAVGATGVGAIALLAVALGWASNTVSHIHLHKPIFRARPANRILSLYLGALLGYPQSLWRYRHLRHHAGAQAHRVPRPRLAELTSELAVIALWLGVLAATAPGFLVGAWLPAVVLGLGLCSLQGRMEHLGGELRGISCYGRVHNALWFNDGFHAEHHRYPGVHWSELPRRRISTAPTSRLPPWLRIVPGFDKIVATALDGLERLVLRSRFLQRRVLAAHRRATARVLPPRLRSIRVVGGGLFPRSVRVLNDLAPGARLEVVDAHADHIACARAALGEAFERVQWQVATWCPTEDRGDVDLTVVPLAFRPRDGAARAQLMAPGRSARLVHTWIWKRPPYPTAIVAWWLLKRIVLIPAR